MVDIVSPIILTANSNSYSTGFFARPYDLKVGTIKDRLLATRPTIFVGVPLVWEKIADKIRAIGAANTGIKKALGDWAKSVNLDHSRAAQFGMPPGTAFGQTLSQKVMGAVKDDIGLDQCKF